MKRIILILIFFSFLPAAAFCKGAPLKLPTGVVEFDTKPGTDKTVKGDKGYPTIAAAVSGDYLWLGRDGGLRRYERASGKWEFFRYDQKICLGAGTINVISDPPYVWSRLTNNGALCRLNPKDKTWHALSHWTVLAHTGPGFPFVMDKGIIYVASAGSPDWEGVSLIDKKSEEWIKLLKTKPADAIYVDRDFLWLGVPEGILRINRITEDYQYYQPYEHGGGAMVKDIIPIPGGIAFATIGNRSAILGDKLNITKNSIQVYMGKQKRWYTYEKSERDKILEDIQAGKIVVTNIETNPGLLIFRDNKWKLLTQKDGLASSEITDLEKDGRFLYLASYNGITVLDIRTLKPVVINSEIFNTLKQVRRIIADDDYIWVFSNRGLFRVEKRLLMSSPR